MSYPKEKGPQVPVSYGPQPNPNQSDNGAGYVKAVQGHAAPTGTSAPPQVFEPAARTTPAENGDDEGGGA